MSAPSDSPTSCQPSSVFPISPAARHWPQRSYLILDEIVGPDIHGPSSSHTAGPQQVGLEVFRALGGQPEVAHVRLFNSLATTGEGHRTPVATTAGLLGFTTTDRRTPQASALAEQRDLQIFFEKVLDRQEHQNCIEITARRGRRAALVRAHSIGGGVIEIVDRHVEIVESTHG